MGLPWSCAWQLESGPRARELPLDESQGSETASINGEGGATGSEQLGDDQWHIAADGASEHEPVRAVTA